MAISMNASPKSTDFAKWYSHEINNMIYFLSLKIVDKIKIKERFIGNGEIQKAEDGWEETVEGKVRRTTE